MGPEPQSSRPSIFSPTDRAKWDSWKAAGQEWKGKEAEAEARYIDIARSLGWTPEVEASEPSKQKSKDDATAEELLEQDSDDEGSSGGGGLGNYVSTLQKTSDEDEFEDSIHGLSVNGDTKRLQALIESHPNIELDELDEYGFTALHLACDRGHADVVELLVKNGADPGVKDGDGFSAIDLAREAQHEHIVSILSNRSKTE